ncbi:MAG: hypothetical protein WBL81_02545 [Pseudolabrys sp.]
MASGIGAKALLIDLLPHWLVMTSGSVFVLFSVFCFGAGVWRHLYPGPPLPVPDAARIPPAILVLVQHSWDCFDRSADRHLARPRLADHRDILSDLFTARWVSAPAYSARFAAADTGNRPEGAGLSPPQRATLSPPQQGLSFFDLQLVQKSHTAWQ